MEVYNNTVSGDSSRQAKREEKATGENKSQGQHQHARQVELGQVVTAPVANDCG